MRALFVCESMFGNTRQIADAIVEGLTERGTAAVVRMVDELGHDDLNADLLIVGAPTHAWGLPRRQSRADPRPPAAPPLSGVREWLATLSGQEGKIGAAFDTRLDKPKFLTGSAARSISRGLTAHGVRLLHPAHSFLVASKRGPLAPGEFTRAKNWGAEIASVVVTNR